ncbi:O-methyltransferase involved in polyketide biosynthesis [Anaerobacterium chartisolvens]|uniref:O-methyltransferase involved in polyketide biosynthesis n=1 Tax=Anaerobacterium chartisolvens TaxID=1297424 RepID=A0A369B990_9FIRM|nr:class I SAM-dependent methyltransferase [Anaerobacterium chartisolvens]RCX17885.1 O-methyltransferase involved in polyketide biosynthesis [Anaerobacterium chartisolvens]
MKMHLKNEMETLIIPLYGKAKMSKMGVFKDPYAEAAIGKLDYDYSRLKIQNKTQVMLAMRAAIIDDFSRSFIGESPSCLVLHLGCGLDARFMRLGLHVGMWYDLDFPAVIDIKKQLYGETDSYKYIASSVTDLRWLEGMGAVEYEVLVIAEGLFMYLSENEIKALLSALKSKFKSYTIIFDAYSKLTAKSSKHHPSLKKTGATIKWGVDDPREMEGYTKGAKLSKTLYLTDKNVIEALPRNYRPIFKLAGLFKSSREAHRVFVMNVRE